MNCSFNQNKDSLGLENILKFGCDLFYIFPKHPGRTDEDHIAFKDLL